MLDTDPQDIARTAADVASPLITVRGLNLWYGETHALKTVSFDLMRRECLAFIGPSGCGKTTMLKCLNRMHDDTRGVRIAGEIRLDGVDIHGPEVDPPALRRRFGWVAQRPNPFAWSVRENVAYGARIHGLVADGPAMDAHVEDCLRRADLWDEVADRLDEPGVDLSGGQQQRLCLARALSTRPDVLLMDEPCGSIDPIASAHVEALIVAMKRVLPVVIITHNMEQARRIADRVAFFRLGEMLEIGPVAQVFEAPRNRWTRDFLAGRFG